MQFIDLKAQQKRIRGAIEQRIQTVLDHGQYIMGPEIAELEKELAGYVGVKHALSCASGTDALLLALMACGIEPGDAVFTTPFTFMATAEVIALLRAVPVFVDIDPKTFNIDPDDLERTIEAFFENDASRHALPKLPAGGKDLRAHSVIAVDLFGLPADYPRIDAIARKHDLLVIQDAAQSFGAELAGRKAGSMALIGCTSFFPAKPLGGYGDGGMCFCDDDRIMDVMQSLRIHGQGHHKYENVRIGINGRLDTLQAAILLEKFKLFPEELELRQQVARRYTELIERDACPVAAPKIPEGCLSAWAQYSVLARSEAERARLQTHLQSQGIPTAIYYPKPLHLQPAFADLGYRAGDLPVSEACAQRIFSLPMHPYLSREDQETIAGALREGGTSLRESPRKA